MLLIKRIISIICKLLFPPKCIFCTSILSIQAKIEICKKCNKSLTYISNKLYYINKYSYKDLEPCKYFDRIFCVFEYAGFVREAIVRYKYFGKAHYYKTFTKLLADKLKSIAMQNEFDIIISVPLHKQKEKKRGYNQAYLISKELSKIMHIPEESNLLIRIKNTPSQSLLHKNERCNNIKNAFKVTDVNNVEGKNILLIDDVLTTGSTVNECSKVLKKAGASKVDIAVIAVAFNFELG
mgnify:CR=1 FL=1